jgi:hypothetical protein
MIELIVSTLVEFGLIREDYKHQKRISKKEKDDGRKRPMQKFFMQPSVLIITIIAVITCISSFLFFTYQSRSIYPEKTKNEVFEMSDRMENWYEKFAKYPVDLNELIGNNPIRQEWQTDAWNRAYKFEITNDGNGYLIISAGSDGKFGTEDDIKSN